MKSFFSRFSKKEEDTKQDGVLLKKNILLGKTADSKEQVIREMGQLLFENGYVTAKYTEAMLEKEKVFNTAIGNYLAIPHGIESMMGEIKKPGLAIFTYPDGVDWENGEIVKLVIGIASAGDEHVEVLAKIAEVCETPEIVEEIIKKDAEEIYRLFS